jgi:formate dehydrogenase iron-sulfur subunit
VTLLSAVEALDDTPVDRFIAEQADLTAIERFAQRHEADVGPRQARYYRDLIPLARPERGQQYGFEVDLDACTGCKSCVAACHSLNGLDEDESWRAVTLLRGGTATRPLQQTVTAACHHCVDPACLNGCPVDAYEKDPVTGIVSHLDDQCIGCSYCTLSCPYEVPVYNKRRGIVRKCDMCSGRLAAGEAPACVQACPNGAIAIKVVDVAGAVAAAGSGALVPGAPPSAITVPTTTYRSAKPVLAVDNALAGLYPPPERLARAHTPLAVMLVLTQLSVGAFTGNLLVQSAGLWHTLVAVAAAIVALGASTLHLGRPQYAYRAVIGLRHSWLSREVVAFAAFTGLASLHALAPSAALGWAASAFGGLGVVCSVLIYTSTHRWRPPAVIARFAITTATGAAAVVALAIAPPRWPVIALWTAALAAAVAAELVERHRFFTHMPRPYGR